MIRGLYGIADAGASGGDPERIGAQMLEGGCRLLQLRAKGWPPDDILGAARALSDRCRAVGATFLVNDWPDIAVAAGADGVHVGQLDASAAEVRRVIGPDRLLGRSTGSFDQIEAALRGADYLAFGPIWPTPHAGRPKPVQGLPRLVEAARLVDGRAPLVAIGGITAARLPGVRDAGAVAWAVIGEIHHASDPVEATRRLL